MQIIHLTDFHLRDPASSKKAVEHAEFVATCLRELTESYPDADCCVITGDLTDRGVPAAYRWLRSQLKGLPFRTVPLIGNHDDRAAFLREFDGQGRYQDGFVQSEMNTTDAKLIFLDTFKPGSDAGTLCQVRLNWLKERLQQSNDQPVLLFMHHPPCRIGDAAKDVIMLDNADAFASVLKEVGNVRHIFFGHVHRNVFVNWIGIPTTCLEEPRIMMNDTGTEYCMAAGIVDLEGGELRITTRYFWG